MIRLITLSHFIPENLFRVIRNRSNFVEAVRIVKTDASKGNSETLKSQSDDQAESSLPLIRSGG